MAGIGRSISVGLHDHNKIFVFLCPSSYGVAKTSKIVFLESSLFDGKSQLTGSPIIATIEDLENGKWFIEARYWVNEKKIIQGVETHLKVSSEKMTWIDGIGIGCNKNGQLIKGSIAHIKGSEDEDEEEKDYKLPDDEKSGPEHSKDIFEVDTSFRRGNTADASIAKASIELSEVDIDLLPIYEGCFEVHWDPKGKILVSQDFWNCPSGYFANYIQAEAITILNKRSENSSIIKIEGYWKNENNDWVPVDIVSLGTSDGNKLKWRNETNLNFTKTETQTVALAVQIKLKGEIAQDTKRIHKKLPQPLNIKFHIIDQDQKMTSHIIQVANPPKLYHTKESVEKSERIKNGNWCCCDDTEHETRNYAIIYRKLDKISLRLYFNSMSNTWDFIMDDFKSIGFKATQENVKEYEMSNMCKRNDTLKHYVNVYFLIDFEREMPYAFKIVMKSSTSSITHYCLIPSIPKPKKGLSPLSIGISPSCPTLGDELEVTFNVQGHEPSTTDWIGIYTDEVNYITYQTNSYQKKYGIAFFELDGKFTKNTKYTCKYFSSQKKLICTSSEFTIE